MASRASSGQAPGQSAAKGGFHRNDDVTEEEAVARWVGFATQLLLMKAQHIRGAVELAVVAVESADLVVAGQQDCDLATRAIERAEVRLHPHAPMAKIAARKISFKEHFVFIESLPPCVQKNLRWDSAPRMIVHLPTACHSLSSPLASRSLAHPAVDP